MYDLIIGKQTMHGLGVVLDVQEKIIKIDKILLPMRNISNLQLKPRITRALRENTCFAQKPNQYPQHHQARGRNFGC
jgi:hypothetical protein